MFVSSSFIKLHLTIFPAKVNRFFNFFVSSCFIMFHENVVNFVVNLTDLDFSFKGCKALHLFLFGCLIVNVHRCFNVGMSHNFLDYFKVRFVLAEARTKSMSQIVYRKMWYQHWFTVLLFGLSCFFSIVCLIDPYDCSIDAMCIQRFTVAVREDEITVSIDHCFIKSYQRLSFPFLLQCFPDLRKHRYDSNTRFCLWRCNVVLAFSILLLPINQIVID